MVECRLACVLLALRLGLPDPRSIHTLKQLEDSLSSQTATGVYVERACEFL